MEKLEDILVRLSNPHQTSLRWFLANAGKESSWPKPLAGSDGEILLASKAKGIYKPKWSKYALSVRQSLKGPYPDYEPIVRSDGTWLFRYFQENTDPSERDDQYTNRGLLECLHDGIPVGVMRQVSQKPAPRYRILGLAMVAGWDGGYFFLEGFSHDGLARSRGPVGQLENLVSEQERVGLETGAFDPTNVDDARKRTFALIVRRRGQPEFRRKLLKAYRGRCAISGCSIVEVLEAAHICPYRGESTNSLQNGLLLRADLHTLFDFGLISIDPDTLKILVSPSLIGTSYEELAGKPITVPAESVARPNKKTLSLHRTWCGF